MFVRLRPLLVCALLAGCLSRGGGSSVMGSTDAGVDGDDSGSADLASGGDDGPQDSRGGADLAARDNGAADLRLVDLASAADLFGGTADVDIYVDNFCNMDVVPKSFSVARGQTLQLTYHNRSKDYPVDVWLSYGGGFLDLPTGGTWADRFTHCSFPRPYDAYADISTACSKYRLMIHCL